MSAVPSRIQPSTVLKATAHRGSNTRYTVPSRVPGSGSIAVRWLWHSRPFARRGCRGCLARCGAFGVLGDAAAQCLHEIDHPVRRGKGLPALWNGAGLLGVEMRQQRLLVAISEVRGVELAGLAVENMLGQREHVRRNGDLRPG